MGHVVLGNGTAVVQDVYVGSTPISSSFVGANTIKDFDPNLNQLNEVNDYYWNIGDGNGGSYTHDNGETYGPELNGIYQFLNFNYIIDNANPLGPSLLLEISVSDYYDQNNTLPSQFLPHFSDINPKYGLNNYNDFSNNPFTPSRSDFLNNRDQLTYIGADGTLKFLSPTNTDPLIGLFLGSAAVTVSYIEQYYYYSRYDCRNCGYDSRERECRSCYVFVNRPRTAQIDGTMYPGKVMSSAYDTSNQDLFLTAADLYQLLGSSGTVTKHLFTLNSPYTSIDSIDISNSYFGFTGPNGYENGVPTQDYTVEKAFPLIFQDHRAVGKQQAFKIYKADPNSTNILQPLDTIVPPSIDESNDPYLLNDDSLLAVTGSRFVSLLSPPNGTPSWDNNYSFANLTLAGYKMNPSFTDYIENYIYKSSPYIVGSAIGTNFEEISLPWYEQTEELYVTSSDFVGTLAPGHARHFTTTLSIEEQLELYPYVYYDSTDNLVYYKTASANPNIDTEYLSRVYFPDVNNLQHGSPFFPVYLNDPIEIPMFYQDILEDYAIALGEETKFEYLSSNRFYLYSEPDLNIFDTKDPNFDNLRSNWLDYPDLAPPGFNILHPQNQYQSITNAYALDTIFEDANTISLQTDIFSYPAFDATTSPNYPVPHPLYNPAFRFWTTGSNSDGTYPNIEKTWSYLNDRNYFDFYYEFGKQGHSALGVPSLFKELLYNSGSHPIYNPEGNAKVFNREKARALVSGSNTLNWGVYTARGLTEIQESELQNLLPSNYLQFDYNNITYPWKYTKSSGYSSMSKNNNDPKSNRFLKSTTTIKEINSSNFFSIQDMINGNLSLYLGFNWSTLVEDDWMLKKNSNSTGYEIRVEGKHNGYVNKFSSWPYMTPTTGTIGISPSIRMGNTPLHPLKLKGENVPINTSIFSPNIPNIPYTHIPDNFLGLKKIHFVLNSASGGGSTYRNFTNGYTAIKNHIIPS